jgi:hypothetical protein
MQRRHAFGLRASLVVAAIVLGLGVPAHAQASDAPWSRYGELLGAYTHAVDAKVGTRVDYRGLGAEPAWKALIAEVGRTDPNALRSRDERLVYWINVYNIFAIDLILAHYPVASIRDIGSFFRPVWKRDAGRIGGRAYSLNEIEHEILRPMGEPRIHAAIVCASISCPDLRREPFDGKRLHAQLDDSLRAWLARPEKGLRVDAKRGVLWLSPVFDWFEDDFESQGGVIASITPHAPDAARRWLMEREVPPEVEYFDYDWSLNE